MTAKAETHPDKSRFIFPIFGRIKIGVEEFNPQSSQLLRRIMSVGTTLLFGKNRDYLILFRGTDDISYQFKKRIHRFRWIFPCNACNRLTTSVT